MSAAIAGKVLLTVLFPCNGVEHSLLQLVQGFMIPPVLELVLLDVALALEVPRGQRNLDLDPGNAIGDTFINAAVQ